MKTFNLSLIASIVVGALASPAQSAEPKLPKDGWVSWEVPAVDDAQLWCCWSDWDKGKASRTTCDLDGGSRNYGNRDDETTDAIKVYVRVKDGKLDRLQSYASSCPVKTNTPIQQLGDVSVDDSARWLSAQVKRGGIEEGNGWRRSVGEDAMAALGMHRGNVARVELTTFARADARTEVRKRAVFWLGLVRGAEGAEVVSSLMFGDKDSEVRKHAAFAMSQSKQPRATADLIQQGNTDKVGDVRAQAWFWLAQTGAPEAEQAILSALRKDADDNVREQAVFALSQLPEDRNTKALINAAEDQTLTREQRKKAVFWLSQSESDSAQSYLEKVLARTAAK